MNGEKRNLLKELKFYSDLLKKHEASQEEPKLQLLSNPQASYSTSWKRESSYKMVKNPAMHIKSQITKYPFNKAHQNTKTKFYGKTNDFKSKYKVSPKATVEDSVPSNKFTFQRTILNKNSQTQNTRLVLHTENTSAKESTKIPENSGKTESHSQSLMKEIESLTQILKKASENKSKVLTTVSKDDNKMQNKQLFSKNINRLNHPSKSYNTSKVTSASSKIKDLQKKLDIPDSNFKLSASLNKNSSKDFAFGKEKQASSFCHSSSMKLAKYSFKKSNGEKCIAVNPSNILEDNVKKSENCSVQNIIKIPSYEEANCQDSKSAADNLSSDALNCKSELLNLDQPLLKPVRTTKLLVDPRSKSINTSKHYVVLKSSFVPNTKSGCGSYRRINGINVSTIPGKRLTKNSFKTLNSNKKIKKNVNNKFKLVNKTPALYRNKMKRIVLSSPVCKENSHLQVDKSDPLFKILNDSSIDKLEQDLLAISTKITATPSNVTKDDNGTQNSSNSFNHKISLKMSQKKYKARISKYKIVNSELSNSAIKIRHSSTKIKSVRKMNSKFSLINNRTTPLRQGNSVLVKRLFKSKKAIVNKNVSPTNQSAKIIKSKYFTLNKRKVPNEKLVLNKKISFFQPRSKGFSSYKVLTRNSKYHKSPVSLYHQKVIRSSYSCHPNSFQFRKCVKNKSRKKLPKGYVRSISIQGVKYSLNPSGKTLRKLPSPGSRKLNRKLINLKDFRTLDHRPKSIIPVSANLASRVLHRSITCALSATSKKGLRKVNTYCMFYNRFGRCNRGVKCTYIHDPSKIAVCTRFLRGTCKINGCPFSHEISPGKMAICSFYLVGACEKVNCPYRHEKLSPDAKLCKAFVQGYCPDGKECKNAHILVCPNYVQGNCEKGTACAFPHPPQKGKKPVSKEVEDDHKKTDDTLLEKVERYFQLSEDISSARENKSDDNVTKVFVPKQRKLEEQPSFIPLSDL